MTRTRLTSVHLRRLADELPARYTTALPHLARVRVLTGAHLDRLLATPEHSPETTARVRRRIMGRLCDLGLADTLGRRIGGARAGSAGHIYTLTTAGHKLLAMLDGEPSPGRRRHSRNPGPLFLSHALTISGIYVDLTEHSGFQVATFTTEPHCWHPAGTGAYLRPDAYVVLRTATHADCWWLEIDQGSESLRRLRAKCRTYTDFATFDGAGPDGVPPRVLFTTPDVQRAAAIQALITGLPPPADQLFSVCLHTAAAAYLLTALLDP